MTDARDRPPEPAPPSPRIAMVAGEASGDLLAGELLQAMRARWPTLDAHGIGGPAMTRHGFRVDWPHEKLAVRGYVEVLRHYAEIAGIRRQLRARLLADPPELFIGVDAPDFNLGLEVALAEAGVPTAHFVCPSIWAWRPKRIETIRRAARHVLCVFPFEPELLAAHGIAATYVGHPLARTIPREPDRAAARLALGLSLESTVLAILPGSRASEIQHMALTFFRAGAQVKRASSAIEMIVPCIPSLRPAIERAAAEAGVAAVVRLVDGRSHAVLAACDLTLIASGTATLEAALFKRPMVIAYKMNALTHRLMKGKSLQPWIGLPNILCREFVVPELIQGDATPEALADAVLAWLADPGRMRAVQQRFAELHATLERDTPQLATDAIAGLIPR